MEEVLLLTDQTRSFQNDFEMSLLAEINAVDLDHTFVCTKYWSLTRKKNQTCVFVNTCMVLPILTSALFYKFFSISEQLLRDQNLGYTGATNEV